MVRFDSRKQAWPERSRDPATEPESSRSEVEGCPALDGRGVDDVLTKQTQPVVGEDRAERAVPELGAVSRSTSKAVRDVIASRRAPVWIQWVVGRDRRPL